MTQYTIFYRKTKNKINNIAKKIKINIALKQTEKELVDFKKPYKLHIGCGQIKLNNWINLDIKEQPKITDIIWDASQGLPLFEDNSCSLIYNEHFLEHLAIEKATVFLSECYRILKPGGFLRIAMPSLEYTIEKYCSEDWRDQDWLTWEGHQFIKTRAEMINIAFRWWGHQWLYDREELHRRLCEAGFQKENIKDAEWRCSEISELNNLETRKDSLLVCEAEK